MTQVAQDYGSGLVNARAHTASEPLTGGLSSLNETTVTHLVDGFMSMVLQRMAYDSIAHEISSNQLQHAWNQKVVYGEQTFNTGLEVNVKLPSRIQGPNTGIRTTSATPRFTQALRWVKYRMGESRNYMYDRDVLFDSLVDYIPYAAGGLEGVFLTNDIFSEMGKELALDVEHDVFDELHDAEHVLGTPGTAVSTSNYSWVKDVITTLSKNEVVSISSATRWMSNTMGWKWVMDEDVFQSLTDFFDTRRVESTAGLAGITDDGDQYFLKKIPIIVTPRVPRQQTGTRNATANINGARPAHLHPGNASSFTVDNLGSNATIQRGESFTVAGVYHASPSTRDSTGVLKKFIVSEDTTANASGQATIPFYGECNDGNMHETSTGGGGNYSPWQNVTAYPADNATITWDGAAGQTIRQAYLVNQNAIDLGFASLNKPWSKDQNTGAFTVPGVPGSINVFNSKFDINTLSETCKFLTLFGANMVDRRKCVRIQFDYL